MSKPSPQSRAKKDETALRKRSFLDAYEKCCHISQAAETAGIDRKLHYRWLASDPEYAAEFAASDAIAVAALEDELVRRAMHGVDEPVFHQGSVCGHVRKFSDRLGEFLLKGRRPDIYGDRFKSEISGPGGSAIETKITLVAVEPPPNGE